MNELSSVRPQIVVEGNACRFVKMDEGVCKFWLAVDEYDRAGKRHVKFFFVSTETDEMASYCMQYVAVGSRCAVGGRVYMGEWDFDARHERHRSCLKIVVEKVELISGPRIAQGAVSEYKGDVPVGAELSEVGD